jgi:hypothetical protein
VLAALGLWLLAVPPAAAQSDPAVSQLSNELVTVRRDLETANAQLMTTREQQVVVARRIDELTGQITAFRAQIAATEAQIEELLAHRQAILDVIRARAAVLYVERDPTSPFEAFTTSAPMKLARREVLADAIAHRDEAERTALKEASAKLAATRDELAAQRDTLQQQETDLQTQQRALADLDVQIQSQQAALNARAKDVTARLQAAIIAGALRGGGPSVVGPTIVNAAQMAAWWRTQHYGGYSVGIPIEALAQLYVDEGNAEGVRGDVAFAQAVVETGGFRAVPGNNFAGMGWCDDCTQGRVFPTPIDGVRAQIQHLKNYGDPTSRASGLQHAPSVYWYAPVSLNQAIANQNFDSFFAKGWAPSWNQMGNGNWATDPRYADKVVKIYASMLGFAQPG